MEAITGLSGIAAARGSNSDDAYLVTASKNPAGSDVAIDAFKSTLATSQKWRSEMKIDDDSVDYFRKARAMRAKYIFDLLNGEWNGALGLLRSAGQFLMHRRLGQYRDSSA